MRFNCVYERSHIVDAAGLLGNGAASYGRYTPAGVADTRPCVPPTCALQDQDSSGVDWFACKTFAILIVSVVGHFSLGMEQFENVLLFGVICKT